MTRYNAKPLEPKVLRKQTLSRLSDPVRGYFHSPGRDRAKVQKNNLRYMESKRDTTNFEPTTAKVSKNAFMTETIEDETIHQLGQTNAIKVTINMSQKQDYNNNGGGVLNSPTRVYSAKTRKYLQEALARDAEIEKEEMKFLTRAENLGAWKEETDKNREKCGKLEEKENVQNQHTNVNQAKKSFREVFSNKRKDLNSNTENKTRKRNDVKTKYNQRNRNPAAGRKMQLDLEEKIGVWRDKKEDRKSVV